MHSSFITLPVSSLQRAVFINLLKTLCSYGNSFSPRHSIKLDCQVIWYFILFVRELLRIVRSFHYSEPSSAFPPHSQIPVSHVFLTMTCTDLVTHRFSDLATPLLSAPLASLLFFNDVKHILLLFPWPEILLPPK